ncbi:TRAP transporter small permease [Yangia mangrovi]|uniref:TRAP transporter small permease protein n=1 Tax=Alloyangia mangrovi TaxID=1779329 RepID=A0A2A3JUN1_9RHOB|nr:TRAP transporter small permease [Alloyangia mangrovi]MCA0940567.1 TRAP transporter small permease [Alloyangia pacifica]MCA0945914.1 TRAP transporter small permease [Alloyangia pacifica]MCT4372579.1 TRAP transporter small permease [Alloyangia mangrovi]
MFSAEVQGRSGISAAVARLVTLWALLGGALLLVIVLINVASVVGAVVLKPFPGDFELTEMGVAVAVFAFLPYCQLTDANVTADIFTANAPRPVLAVLRALASLIAFGFAGILVWRMYLGMLDQKAYNYTTTILQVPIWWAFVPILVSLALLIAAAAVTFRESLSEVRT